MTSQSSDDPSLRFVKLSTDDENFDLEIVYRKVNDTEIQLLSVSSVDYSDPDHPVATFHSHDLRKDFGILVNLAGLLLSLDRVVNTNH